MIKPEPKAIDLREIKTVDDLETIKKQDPFMYFSIPAVKSARMLMREVDTSNLEASALSRNCISCPSRLETMQHESLQQKVTRTTRVSVECHPDLLFEDIMNEDEDTDMEDIEGEDLDLEDVDDLEYFNTIG